MSDVRALTSDVRLIKMMVLTCYHCRHWLMRVPLWYGTGDKGDSCPRCGTTAVNVRDGRPIGPRSKWWAQDIKEAEELLACFTDNGPGTDREMIREIEDALIRGGTE
jgi:hypothetical protein